VIPLWILRTLQKALRDPLLAQLYLFGKSIRQVAREEGRDPATICRWHRKKLREVEEEILRGPPDEDADGPMPIPAWLPLPRPGGGSLSTAAR
jgi:hypothetical protein